MLYAYAAMLNRVVERMLRERSTAGVVRDSEQLEFVELNSCAEVGNLRYRVFDDRIRYEIGNLVTFSFYFDDFEEYKDLQAARIVGDFLELVDELKKSRIVVFLGENTSGLARIPEGSEISLDTVNAVLEEDAGYRLDETRHYDLFTWSGKVGI